MKKALLDSLKCRTCQKSQWELRADYQDEREVREGTLQCTGCQATYPIHRGILNTIQVLSEEVAHEKEHAESHGYIETSDGTKHPINEETIQAAIKALEALEFDPRAPFPFDELSKSDKRATWIRDKGMSGLFYLQSKISGT